MTEKQALIGFFPKIVKEGKEETKKNLEGLSKLSWFIWRINELISPAKRRKEFCVKAVDLFGFESAIVAEVK